MDHAWRLRYGMNMDPEDIRYYTDFNDDLVMADYDELVRVERSLERAGLRHAASRLHHHLWMAKRRVSEAARERRSAWAAERRQPLPSAPPRLSPGLPQ